MVECDEDDANATLLVQHVTNATLVYELPASSFYENTWENMVDPKVAQEAFVSSWNADMNFVKGLIFANKEAVKRALTIYARKHNRNIMTSKSTKSRLSVKCVNESCMWYVGAVAKPEHGLWIVTSYRGPHSCIPLATALDGKMMDCNFLAAEFVPLLQEKHTATIYHLGDFIKGPSTSTTTLYGTYRQTCRRKLCLRGVLEYNTVHIDAQPPLLHHRATLGQFFLVTY